jgi:hypothetical protein
MNASILDFLKTNGERLEAEIANALHVPMTLVQSHVSQLSSAGEVVCCKVTRFLDGKKIEGTSCRLSYVATIAKTGYLTRPSTSATQKK